MVTSDTELILINQMFGKTPTTSNEWCPKKGSKGGFDQTDKCLHGE